MTLRDRYLMLRVASPRGCNNATNAPSDATARATPAQQTAPLHRGQDAATDATTTQQATEGHATNVQQDQGADATTAPTLRAVFDVLRGAGARECNTQRRNSAVAEALADAINRACDARGDDAATRAGLLAECAALPPEGQADMLAHFTIEAARWAAPAPDSRVTCTTCAHYLPHRCSNYRAAGLQGRDIAPGLATLLQHCLAWAVRGPT